MKQCKIVISSLKGGTGKTTVTINLGRAFQRMGCKVGLLDIDVTAPTLGRGLGLGEIPKWDLDSQSETIIPFEVDGIYALTMASHYGEVPAVLWDEKTLIDAMRQLVTGVIQWPEDLDYILMDSPPSSSGFMQALYDYLPDIYGAILVFQPTDIATADLLRTIDFIRFKKVPILGLISNMSYCLSPKGESFWPFLSPEIDLGGTCHEFGIPLLGSIPMTSDRKAIEKMFDQVVLNLDGCQPVILKDDTIQKLYKALKRRLMKAVVKRL